jgi:hypothetical protein
MPVGDAITIFCSQELVVIGIILCLRRLPAANDYLVILAPACRQCLTDKTSAARYDDLLISIKSRY